MRERAEKLPRPPIPLAVKCRVVLKQLGEMFIDEVIRTNRFVPRDHRKRSLGRLLAESIERLRVLQNEEGDPQLDHDPQLEQREKVRDAKGKIVGYIPDANDPAYLFYRWDHGIKTNVRGDHGQFSDVAIRKRARRRRREPYITPLGPKGPAHKETHKKRPGRAMRSQGFVRPSVSRAKLRTGKRKLPTGRKLRSQNNLRRRKR